MEPLVLLTEVESVATITLNNPRKLNALTAQTFEELRAAIDTVAGQGNIACVVLTGAGRSFSAGHSLDALADGDGEGDARYHEAETIDALESLPMPTVAAIRGHCLTGGLELALGCDILLATETASLGDTHGQWGLVPVWGMSVRLPERVGYARAKELTFTGRRISGIDAAAIGLVNRAVADDELDTAVAALTAEIAANSAGANQIAKRLYAQSRTLDRSQALSLERDLPFGLPADAADRLAGSLHRKK
ncbi:enoyl-CoA hydratase-related protein [Rhodococcus olei]|uniref:Enoyl-CoA hydratase-related protein n=1 Tax=Rhodococcus olei TaxID=2161675 RepID=A0ABP8PBA7_9NOCA